MATPGSGAGCDPFTASSLGSEHRDIGDNTELQLFEAKERSGAQRAAISPLNLLRMEADHKNLSPPTNMVQRNVNSLHLRAEPKTTSTQQQRARKQAILSATEQLFLNLSYVHLVTCSNE